MRVRKKTNLESRLEQCKELLILPPVEGEKIAVFANENPIYIEIGCGKGRFICESAMQNPHINFIAVEKVSDVLIMALERARGLELPNLRFLRIDARELLKLFGEGAMARIYLNFSDPWKKNKQGKRRLTHSGFLALYKQLLAKGGELHFKTDNHPLFEFSLGELRRSGWEPLQLTYDLHENGNPSWNIMTEYEQAWMEKGAKIHRVVAVPPMEKQDKQAPKKEKIC